MSRRPSGFYGGSGFGANWGGGGAGGGGGTPGGSDTQVQFNDGSAFGGDAGLTFNKTTDILTIGSAGALAFSTDLFIRRDAPNTFAQRNSTAPQTHNWYKTFTDASNGAWSFLDVGITNANAVTIGTTGNGTGVATLNKFIISVLGVTKADWSTAVSGVWTFAGGVNTPYIHFGVNNSFIDAPSDGLLRMANYAGSSFGSLLFGPSGTTYNRIKHGGTGLLQVRLADDSAFAAIQGNLRTQANAVAETPTATHTMIITDAGGTAYRVLCVV